MRGVNWQSLHCGKREQKIVGDLRTRAPLFSGNERLSITSFGQKQALALDPYGPECEKV